MMPTMLPYLYTAMRFYLQRSAEPLWRKRFVVCDILDWLCACAATPKMADPDAFLATALIADLLAWDPHDDAKHELAATCHASLVHRAQGTPPFWAPWQPLIAVLRDYVG